MNPVIMILKGLEEAKKPMNEDGFNNEDWVPFRKLSVEQKRKLIGAPRGSVQFLDITGDYWATKPDIESFWDAGIYRINPDMCKEKVSNKATTTTTKATATATATAAVSDPLSSCVKVIWEPTTIDGLKIGDRISYYKDGLLSPFFNYFNIIDGNPYAVNAYGMIEDCLFDCENIYVLRENTEDDMYLRGLPGDFEPDNENPFI